MKAKDIMRRDVLTVTPLTTVRDLAEALMRAKVSGAPVIDKEGNLRGVVSQTDIVRHGRDQRDLMDYYKQPGPFQEKPWPESVASETLVIEIMTPAVIEADEESSVEDLGRLMLENHIHRIIITKDGRLSGIVTTTDLVGVVAPLSQARAG